MTTPTTDQTRLLQALSQAKIARGLCAPNPAVGALIVNGAGQPLSQGYHTGPGNPHAEIEALKNTSLPTQNTTLYVTLEPCCHWGKTPPCTDEIIQAGIKRVVYGYLDPNPLVAGKGIQQLTEQGITCNHIPLPEINTFYESYQHWSKTHTPFITAKIAMTLDGKIAGKNGERITITDQLLQELTHAYRKNTDAILTTAKTIINDNPQLNARYENQIISKPLYILDSQLTILDSSAIYSTAKSITIFHSEKISAKRLSDFKQLNVRYIPISESNHGLNLTEIIKIIGADGIHDLWIEAGGTCFAAFWQNQLLQCALIYISPKWLGEGQSAFNFPMDFSQAKSLNCKTIGKEFLLEIRS
jgi:diaminohydroxyphosphoribosylaminopyrimidine deaminase/5-amino-6-(5-phosphoribosylamino)uracil reductase